MARSIDGAVRGTPIIMNMGSTEMQKLMPAVICTVALAAPAVADGIQVEGAWAAMMENETDRGDIILIVTNKGQAPDQLYAVKTPVAKKAVLGTATEAAVLKGREQPALAFEVLPGQPLALSEDGPHIELFGLETPLVVGDSSTVTLFFEYPRPLQPVNHRHVLDSGAPGASTH
jgi:copper(I)-binding protein